MLTLVHAYENAGITFRLGDNLMVNANEMAKPFHKVPGKWLELPSAKDFLHTLKTIRQSDNLIQTYKGRGGSTWFHEDVALEFARWLSPSFGIWCNDRVRDIIRKQSEPPPQPTLEHLLTDPKVMVEVLMKFAETMTELKKYKAKVEKKQTKEQQRIENAAALLKESMPLRAFWTKADIVQKALLAKLSGRQIGTVRHYANGRGKNLAILHMLIEHANTIPNNP